MALSRFRLYYDDDRLNQEGEELCRQARQTLHTIFHKYSEMGYSMRDVAGILVSEIMYLEAEHVLSMRMREL